MMPFFILYKGTAFIGKRIIILLQNPSFTIGPTSLPVNCGICIVVNPNAAYANRLVVATSVKYTALVQFGQYTKVINNN